MAILQYAITNGKYPEHLALKFMPKYMVLMLNHFNWWNWNKCCNGTLPAAYSNSFLFGLILTIK